MAQLEPLEPPENSEPRSIRRPRSPRFLVGKDRDGNWVVQDQARLHGRLFISRADALRLAMFENGLRPLAVVMVPTTLELSAVQSAEKTDIASWISVEARPRPTAELRPGVRPTSRPRAGVARLTSHG
jgi:hypothetical protein